ncbi:hypothetical protein [Botrimarina mediterranea]|uniref:hypothetical protein n=1 Tax=Botrimarina mediterranea TaxID=2528022 RepID=UPI00118CF5CC|nr:hypothetical protein K2D_19270 [Planctomycetes bacterium K2D]
MKTQMLTQMLLLAPFLLVSLASGAHAQADRNDGNQELVIAHRVVEWQTKHFDDQTKAKQHSETLTRLGAEVRMDQHEGHFDVTYRSPSWRPLRVESDTLAHQWQEWLRASGFETIHGHSPDHDEHAHHEGHDHEQGDAASDGDIVLYRAPAWGAQHFDQPGKADEFVVLTQALRCQVETTGHAGHTDIRFVCPEWTAVEFPNHKVAAAWMKWLESAGFEVKHEDHYDH